MKLTFIALCLLLVQVKARAADEELCQSLRTIESHETIVEPYSFSYNHIMKNNKALMENPAIRELKNAYSAFYLKLLLRIETNNIEKFAQDVRECSSSTIAIEEMSELDISKLDLSEVERSELLAKMKSQKMSTDSKINMAIVISSGTAFAGMGVIVLGGGALATGAAVTIGGTLFLGGGASLLVAVGTSAWRNGPPAIRVKALKNFGGEKYSSLQHQSRVLASQSLLKLLM